jgi:hypothetical protein
MGMKMYEQSLKTPLAACSFFRLLKVTKDKASTVILLTDEAHRWYVLLLQSFHISLGYLPKPKRPVARKKDPIHWSNEEIF